MTTHKVGTSEWLRERADGKLICATHFNWWGYSKEWDGYKWLKKPWDAHHATGGEDPANDKE